MFALFADGILVCVTGTVRPPTEGSILSTDTITDKKIIITKQWVNKLTLTLRILVDLEYLFCISRGRKYAVFLIPELCINLSTMCRPDSLGSSRLAKVHF